MFPKPALVVLKILNSALMLLRSSLTLKSAKIPAFSGLRVFLS
jgi:hypothetical protein